MSKVQTTKIGGGADYAKVPARLKAFRETNPRAGVDTEPLYQPDGSLIFKAIIVTDKSDETSASATGHARYSAKEMEKPKAFEKLETISVGRSLSLLGYLADGEIASSEEMEEFEDFKKTKQEEKLEQLREEVDNIKSVEELREFYKNNRGHGKEFDEYVTEKATELQGS